ncbi:MAG: hypothetical protein AB1589_11770 [Cyanobacteriota bacterium]
MALEEAQIAELPNSSDRAKILVFAKLTSRSALAKRRTLRFAFVRLCD